MAAELGLLSLTQLQQLLLSATQPQSSPSSTDGGSSSWMWNPNPSQRKLAGQLDEDEDSWEVRAFAEDTGNMMGTTWPPRSYTCTFCRREFRSAQALGGHMNVHRRDRARLHQTQYPQVAGHCSFSTTSNSTVPPPLIIPNHDFVARGGLCLLYQLPNPNGSTLSTGTINNNASLDSPSPSTLLSISAYRPNSSNDSFHSEAETLSSNNEGTEMKNSNNMRKEPSVELDLELRLGQRPTPS